MADVVVLVPVLGRPWRVAPLLASVLDSIEENDVDLLFVVTPNDMEEIEKLRRVRANFLVTTWPAGHADWAKKINLGYRETTHEWLFTGADDLCFCPGWADRALECALSTGAGVVGTQDLANPRVISGQHSTHNLVARWYADDHGTVDGAGAVVSEVYAHNFVDDELVATARARGLYAFCDAAEVPHLHPNVEHDVPKDATYQLGEKHFNSDRMTFHRRRALFSSLRAVERGA